MEKERQALVLTSVSKQKKKLVPVMIDGLFLWCYLSGITVWLISTFRLEASPVICLLAEAGIAAAAQGIHLGKKRMQFLMTEIWYLILALYAVVFRGLFLSGIHVFCNQAAEVVGVRFPYLFPAWSVTVAESMEQAALAGALIWFAALLMLPAYELVKRGNRLFLGIQLAALLIFQMMTGITPGLAADGYALVTLLAVWIRGNGEGFPEQFGRGALLESVLTETIGIGILAAAGMLVLTRLPLAGNQVVASWKSALVQATEKLCHDGGNHTLPEGDFKNLGSFEPKEETVLEVTMSKPESYYLRGFVGSVYTGTGWKQTDGGTLWKSRDLFYWLHKENFFGQEELGDAAVSLDPSVAEEEKNQITIVNQTGSSNYIYVPYELQSAAGSWMRTELEKQKIGDAGILADGLKGSRSYSYEALSNQVTKYPRYAEALYEEDTLDEAGKAYQEKEAYYNEFVYQTYLEIPETLRGDLYDLFGAAETGEGKKHLEYAEAKQKILYLLTSSYEDTRELPSSWNGSDFIRDFLVNDKAGYSVHFASAAVMMFRYFGIPARYVEGYLLTPEDAVSMEPDVPYAVDDTHAHAWVEYYQDGVGWLPFEITPSYLTAMAQADEYQDISGIAGDSAVPDDTNEEEQEEDQVPSENEPQKTIDWVLVFLVLLIIGISLFVLIMIGFLIWLILQRRKSRRAKEMFRSEDSRLAVRALFAYIMNILSVAGLKVQNRSLYSYAKAVEKLFDPQTADAYRAVVAVRQKAVYSEQEISEEERQLLAAFKDQLWNRIYTEGRLIQRLQLKYIYFL